jgi:multidrug efflux pump subunit AcrA (membrane-fusion protein)
MRDRIIMKPVRSTHCRRLFAVLLPAVVFLFAASAVSVRAQFGGPQISAVRVQAAEERTVASTLEFTGAIEPWRRIELSAQVEGLVAEIPIEEGQPLRAGETVCRLDAERAGIDVARFQARADDAAAELRLYLSGYREEDVRRAEKSFEETEARYERVSEEWERQRPLVEDRVISAVEGTRLRTIVDEARGAMDQAQAELDRLRSGYRAEEIAQARARAAAADADLREAQWKQNRHAIAAPMNAVVVRRLREPGEWVETGEAVAELLVLDPLKVRIDVPQAYLSQVASGQSASLTIDGLPDALLTARLTNILPQAGDGSRNFAVLLKLENPDGRLRAGLFARVKLAVGAEAPTVMIPRRAIMIRGDTLSVLVAGPISAEATTHASAPATGSGAPGEAPPAPDAILREAIVRTGAEMDDMVAVESIQGEPIRAGDRIVTLGGAQLSGGVPVRILSIEQPERRSAADAATPPTRP